MKYVTQDGEPIEGATPQEVVTALRDGGRFTAGQGLEEYMEGFADRMMEYNNSLIRYDDPAVFIEDLVRVSYLTPEA